jgi:hypothetical protein
VYNTEKPSSGLPHRHKRFRNNLTIILSAALYGFETWSLTLREEHRPRVFGNRMLRALVGRGNRGVEKTT